MPMLRIQAENIEMASDGATSQKRVIDLSAALSAHYGRLIRQGQVFMIRGLHFRLRNPGGVIQDEVMDLSGQLEFFQPTGNRKKAWAAAFKAVQAHRRLLGIREENYDFRVSLNEDYGTVPFNAWINEENDPLYLARTDDSILNPTHHQGIFNVYNEGLTGTKYVTPTDPESGGNGFGTPFMTASMTDEAIDFTTDETPFFVEGWAHESTESIPFQLGFTSVYDSFTGLEDDASRITNSVHIDLSNAQIPVMCGLLGVHIDTTAVDDAGILGGILLGPETTLEVSVDVERWSPIL